MVNKLSLGEIYELLTKQICNHIQHVSLRKWLHIQWKPFRWAIDYYRSTYTIIINKRDSISFHLEPQPKIITNGVIILWFDETYTHCADYYLDHICTIPSLTWVHEFSIGSMYRLYDAAKTRKIYKLRLLSAFKNRLSICGIYGLYLFNHVAIRRIPKEVVLEICSWMKLSTDKM